MGRAVYEANVPDNFRRPQTDSALESFIRAKYETKKYIAKEWVPQPPAKIDWEKEMDEEEKQKKKKKAASGSTTTATTGVPKIPPPSTGDKKSSTNKTATIPPPLPKIGNLNSPKSNRTERKSATNGASDLLGLNTSSETSSATKADSNNDNFANFLSAPTTTPAVTDPTPENSVSQSKTESKPSSNSGLDNFTSLDKEEADFFNQTTADKEKSAKMTKDSILALYGSAPINPINNFNQGFNGVAATNFLANSSMPTGIPQQYPTMMNNQFATTTTGQVVPPQMIPQFGMAPQMPNQWATPVMGQQPSSMHMMAQPLGASIPTQMFNYHQPNSLPNVVHPVAAPTMTTSADTMAKHFGSLNLNNVWQ